MKIKRENIKWYIAWSVLGLFIGFLVLSFFLFKEKKWCSDFLQFFGVCTAIYAAILIYLHNSNQQNKSTQQQILALNENTNKHIVAISDNTSKQINEFRNIINIQIESFKKQSQKEIEAIKNSTKEQISELRKSTSEKINAIQQSTFQQITTYQENTEVVVNQLNNNSIILSYILVGQLESAVLHINKQINSEKIKLNEIYSFQIGRSESTKRKQIQDQEKIIKQLKNYLEYLQGKYKEANNLNKKLNS